MRLTTGDLLRLAGRLESDLSLERERAGLLDLERSMLLGGEADLPLSL